jgi:hypothetical protein
MFSASGYGSYHLCDAFGLPAVGILHEPNHRIVASKVPLCACRACIPSAAEFSYFANTALRGELVATPRGRVTLFYEGTQELMARIAAARFERALQSAFEFVARDGAFQLRRRVKTADEAVCAGIAE